MYIHVTLIGLHVFKHVFKQVTVEPRYNEDFRTMTITLLYQVSLYQGEKN